MIRKLGENGFALKIDDGMDNKLETIIQDWADMCDYKRLPDEMDSITGGKSICLYAKDNIGNGERYIVAYRTTKNIYQVNFFLYVGKETVDGYTYTKLNTPVHNEEALQEFETLKQLISEEMKQGIAEDNDDGEKRPKVTFYFGCYPWYIKLLIIFTCVALIAGFVYSCSL